MTEKTVVGWDCDGVHAESHVPVLKFVNQRYPSLNIRYQDLTDFSALYSIALNHTHDKELATEINKAWFTADILRQAPPNRLTLLVTKWSQKIGVDNHVITTRLPELADSTADWYRQHLPFIVHQNRLHLRKYLSQTGDQFKVDQCQLLKANFFVEDSPATVDAFLASGFNNIFLVSRSWNLYRTDLDYLRYSNPLTMFVRIANHRLLHL